jgi:hypothetical protein
MLGFFQEMAVAGADLQSAANLIWHGGDSAKKFP